MGDDSILHTKKEMDEREPIFKTPSRRKTTVWPCCNFTPSQNAENMGETSDGNVTVRKRKKRTSDYCIQLHNQPSTFHTPLKLFDPDKEIEDLVNCVKAGGQNSPELKVRDDAAPSNPSKKRRLSMPAQCLSGNNFDPLKLFSETPQESARKKRRRASLRLPRKPVNGNCVRQNNSPLARLKSPSRTSKIPIFRISPGSPVLTNRIHKSLKFSYPTGSWYSEVGPLDSSTSRLPVPSWGRKLVKNSTTPPPKLHASKDAKQQDTTQNPGRNAPEQPIMSLVDCEKGPSSVVQPLEIGGTQDGAEDRVAVTVDVHSGLILPEIQERLIAGLNILKTPDPDPILSTFENNRVKNTQIVTQLGACCKEVEGGAEDCSDAKYDSGFVESASEVEISSEKILVKQENGPGIESDSINSCRGSVRRKEVKIVKDIISVSTEASVSVPFPQNPIDGTSERKKLLQLKCVLFPTKHSLRLNAVLESMLKVNMKASNVSSEIHNDAVPQSETLCLIVSSPTADGLAQGRQEDITSPKETPNVRRSTRTKTKIRKSVPKLQVRHTPLGLPKPIREKKDKFSLEEIYLNKNFKTPTEKKWETIFEFPKENKDGSVSTHEKRKKRRRCDFMTDPSQRKVKWKKSKLKASKRKFKAFDGDLDKILSQKLINLDNDLKIADLSP